VPFSPYPRFFSFTPDPEVIVFQLLILDRLIALIETTFSADGVSLFTSYDLYVHPPTELGPAQKPFFYTSPASDQLRYLSYDT